MSGPGVVGKLRGSGAVYGPPLAAALVVALARVPAATALFPVLGVLRGPLGALLLAAGLMVALARALPSRLSWRPLQLTPWVAFVLGACLTVPLGLYYASRLRVSGDEPHYLLMAQSLWREGDLRLEDNLEREDFLEYTPGPIRPHYGAPRKDGRPYPAHSPGLPALLAPFYALGGRLACVVVLALMGAGVAAQTLVLARSLGLGDPPSQWAFWAALGPPVLFYSFHVYTEVPSALALVVGLNLLRGAAVAPRAAVGAALAASVLPWLHVKMVLPAVGLGLLALVRLRGWPLLLFTTTTAAMAAAYAAYYQSVFGQPTPLAIYGGVPADVALAPLRALGGLLLDRSFGLWPHAPVFVLAALALGPLARDFRAGAGAAALLAAVVLPALFWRMWWGGQCPPGRFLVPAAPLLGLAVAAALSAPARGIAHWRWPLLIGGFALAGFMTHDPGALMLLNRGNRPTRVWAALSGDVPIERYLPSLTLADPAEERVALVWAAALAALFALHLIARRSDRLDGWFRGLALPALLAAGVGAGVDGWARRGVAPPDPAAVSSSVR